jgi:predicted nucleic acid-binding protein
MRFVDTNVLLYSLSTAPDEEEKAAIALALLAQRDLGLSVQVLQEFYVQATRATRPDRLDHHEVARLIDSFVLRFPVAAITVELMGASLRTAPRFHISLWDAAVIEAARVMGCGVVLSEDLNAGQDYDGVVVENPFR